MPKPLFAIALAVLIGGAVSAAEIKGKVKSVDNDKGAITLAVGGQEQTIAVHRDATVYYLGKAKKGEAAPKLLVAGGLSGIKDGSEVTVTTETKDGKDVATAIKVDAAPVKKKKKA